ncbi:sulfotransferase family 2 domain-containing protein [Algicella marina]|uniref:Sulfotransferase family protein n=1 Tax=Algicella marina TaxID=2683284 RepID=A0A6P1SYL0_9RHOB|nr:sulfotransferase family 2 domain-containing protein [Algicella marina]QHQ35558.1 hypothetical protein GO499_10380 [Algicella marina]
MAIGLYQRLKQSYPAPGVMNGAFHLWEGPDFVYVNNPKAVCTSTKFALNNAIAVITGKPYAPLTFDEVHNRENGLMKRPSDMPQETVDRLLEAPGVHRFTFVRDPLSRLVSAVASKLDPSKGRPQRARLCAHLGLSDDVTFTAEFVANVFREDAGALNLDKHWKPQVDCIAYGLMPYTMVGRSERWDADFAVITTRIFGAPIPSADTRTRFGHVTPRARHITEATPRLRRLVEEVYALDYEMLAELEAKALLCD